MTVPTVQRLKFSSFAFDRFPNSRCRASVGLEQPDGLVVHEAVESAGAAASELRCAALATAEALNKAVGEACVFELLGVKPTTLTSRIKKMGLKKPG